MIKPPVQVFGLEGRYASALYSAATKNKTLDAVEKDLTQFQQSIKSDPKLKEFLINPTLKRNLKVDALKAVAAKVICFFVVFNKHVSISESLVLNININTDDVSYHYRKLLKSKLSIIKIKKIQFQINLSPATGNLLGLLAENGRLSKLETVINAFKIMMAAHRGEVTCEVITAKPLDQAQRQNLEAALKV